jgi:hypothetical protein
MEFGGSVKADWKCAFTYSKSHGKFSKKVDCNFSSTDGSGMMTKLTQDDSEEEA